MLHFLVFNYSGVLCPIPIHTSTLVEVQTRYSCVLEYYDKQDCVATIGVIAFLQVCSSMGLVIFGKELLMTNDDFLYMLKHIDLPCGVLLSDNTTYRLETNDYSTLKYKEELEGIDKVLVISDGKLNVVGGVLFYGGYDIQITTLPQYRNKGYMSAIHRNGILYRECYPNLYVSLVTREIRHWQDFHLRHHLVKLAGLIIRNLPEVYKHLFIIRETNGYTEEAFIKKFS